MRILHNKSAVQKIISGMCVATVVALAALLSTGCNQDGVGIYYAISQEEKQLTSKISELNVYEVVENGGTIFALGGRTVWRQSGSNWSDLGGGYVYNIAVNNSNLFAFLNDDDVELDDGRIKQWTGSNWQLRDSFSNKGKLVDIGNNTNPLIALVIGGSSSPTLYITDDLSGITVDVGNNTDEDFYIVDGTILGTDHYLISDSGVYSCANGTPTDLTNHGFSINGTTTKSGDLAAITTNGTNLYIVTTTGQIYKSTDSAVTWDFINSVETPVYSKGKAAEVVNIGPTDPDDYYLIIGTYDGYYEMNVGTEVVSNPTDTTSADGDSFAAAYPDLDAALVYQVYQSSNMSAANEFYLATQNGLWKRTSSGEFQRQ